MGVKLSKCECALSRMGFRKNPAGGKIKDPALVEKWKPESLDQLEGEYRVRRLTKRMVNTPHFRPLTSDSTF